MAYSDSPLPPLVHHWLSVRSAILAALLLGSFCRADVVIGEFLAANTGGLRDADGASPDWIELHNTGHAPANLAGWALTDDPNRPQRWPIPGITLDPDERRVIFASGKDRRDPAAELHTNFAISKAAGGFLALRRPDGSQASTFANYPEQHTNISYGPTTIRDGVALVDESTAARLLVPTDGGLGDSWKSPAFDDTAWTAVTHRIGYQLNHPGTGLPIAYWTFDDTDENAIAGGPAVQRVGATYNGSTPGPIGAGSSLDFNRAGSHHAIADLDVSETAYSASFWFRTTQTTTGLFSVTSGTLGANGHDRHVYLNGGNIRARTWNNETISSTGKNYADNQWHHVAHVVGAGGQRLYVDGIQVAAGSKAQSDFNWQNRIHIGFSNDAGGATHHHGQIDDLSIWSEALGPAAVSILASGTAPDTLAGLSPYIDTNVESAMHQVNATAFLRLPFNVNRSTPFNHLELKVRYDDGFIAFINGVEVARRNAPSSPNWQSAALTDRPTESAAIEEIIDLTEHLGLIPDGNHVLAIHALNDTAASPDFLLTAELHAATITHSAAAFMDPPTPGAPNASGFSGFVESVVASPRRGLFDGPLGVTLHCATPGATIVYTTNGTDPSPSNGIRVPALDTLTPPSVQIAVTATRTLRVMAYLPASTVRDARAESHSYILIPQVLTQPATPPRYPTAWAGRAADYGMDPNVVNQTLPGYSVTDGLLSLPTISVSCPINSLFGTTAPRGIYYDTTQRGITSERKVSVEWINPDGSPGWHIQAGMRPHGNSSRFHSFTPKHPLRLNFRSRYGDSRLRQDLFGGGLASFNELLLRGCSTDSMPVIDGNISDGEQRWNNDKATYMRDQYIRDLLNELGHPNCRGVYAHLYLNGLYWGLYNLAERPTADWFASTFGGAKEEWDVIKDFQEVNDGDAATWNAMAAIINDSSLSDAARCQKLLGNHPDGSRNLAFPILLHWPSFLDYMIVHIAAGAEDWPDHNYWAGRRRGPDSEGFRFVAWDQEISNDSLTRLSGRGSNAPFESVGNPAVDSGFPFGPAKIYDKFRRAEPFKSLFRERTHQLLFNGGALTSDSQRARWMAIQQIIDKAIVPESARWGDANGEGAKKRETTWLNNMAYMNTPVTGYWDAIHPIAVRRFRNVSLYPSIDQATFSQNGGFVSNGFQLSLSHPQATIHYTTDGSDPMGPGGQPSPQSQSLISNPITLTTSGHVTARARTAGGEWSGLNSHYFAVGAQSPGPSNIVISELHYHPADPARPQELAVTSNPKDFEFIELMNVGSVDVNFDNARFADGLHFEFPPDFSLAPGQRCVVVRHQAAFEARYGTGRDIVGIFGVRNGKQTGLSNSGETLSLTLTTAGITTTLISMTYSDRPPWPVTPDGMGPSLVLRNPRPGIDHNNPANWAASADLHGSPGQAADQITYSDWARHFPDAGHPLGDADGDGIHNLLEYALLTDPLHPNPADLPAPQMIRLDDLPYLAVTFRHRPASDLELTVQTSAELLHWTGEPDVVRVSQVNHGDGSFTETWRAAQPVNAPGNTTRFLRLHARITP